MSKQVAQLEPCWTLATCGRELAPFFTLRPFRRHQEPMSSPEDLWHLPGAVRKHHPSPGPRIMESHS